MNQNDQTCSMTKSCRYKGLLGCVLVRNIFITTVHALHALIILRKYHYLFIHVHPSVHINQLGRLNITAK